jgi:hypothetical protein
MGTTILMSGPIRPSEEAVLSVIASIRRQFPESRIILSTWTESPRLREAVDVFQATPEPTDAEIRAVVRTQTIQHRQLSLPDTTPGGVLSTYKMMYGVQLVCSLAETYLSDGDRVLRIRTDSMLELDPEYLASILASPPAYLAKKGDGFDWFALTTFGALKKTWCFRDIQDFNRELGLSWNPESLIARRVPVPVTFLDSTRVDAYILRENGRKHYYP